MAEDQSGTISQMEADLDSETLPREELSVVKPAFSPLTNSEAKQLLENPPKDKVSTIPPILPKAGEVYIYSVSELVYKGEMITCSFLHH